jgi:TatA/E family protein of Tat protein translocase
VFGISGTEFAIVALFAFIIFGPDKIPEIARTVSKAIAMFKQTQEDMEKTIKAEMAGLDLDSVSSLLGGSDTKTDDAPKAAKAPSASALYGIGDEDEEDEE